MFGFETVSVIAVSSPQRTELGENEMLVVGLLSVLICKLTEAPVLFCTVVPPLAESSAEKSPTATANAKLVPPAETEVTLNEYVHAPVPGPVYPGMVPAFNEKLPVAPATGPPVKLHVSLTEGEE